MNNQITLKTKCLLLLAITDKGAAKKKLGISFIKAMERATNYGEMTTQYKKMYDETPTARNYEECSSVSLMIKKYVLELGHIFTSHVRKYLYSITRSVGKGKMNWTST